MLLLETGGGGEKMRKNRAALSIVAVLFLATMLLAPAFTSTQMQRVTSFRTGGGAVSADTDSGLVELADDLQIMSLDAEITNIYGYGANIQNTFVGLKSPTLQTIYYEDLILKSIYTNLLPFAETGFYKLHTGGGGFSVHDEVDFYWDWEIKVEVNSITNLAAPVPEPATCILMGMGLIGLIGWTRKKK